MAKPAPHIVPPASAAEISRDLGVTEEDIRRVDRVLAELGLLGKSKTGEPAKRASSKPKIALKRKTLKDTGGHLGASKSRKSE